MAVKITATECIGCGSCVSGCPFGVITMENNIAIIGDGCTQCGACVETCPVARSTRWIEPPT